MARTLVPGCNVGLYDNNAYQYHEVKFQTYEELRGQFPGAIVKQPRSCATVYFDVKLPFPMKSKRRYVVCSSLMYDPAKDQVMLLHKPLTNHGIDSSDPLIDIWDFQYYRLRKLDDNHTQFAQIHCFNLKGWATSKTLQKLIVWDRAKKFKMNSTRVLKKARDGKLEPAPAEDYLNRLLLEQNIEQQREEYRLANLISTPRLMVEEDSTVKDDANKDTVSNSKNGGQDESVETDQKDEESTVAEEVENEEEEEEDGGSETEEEQGDDEVEDEHQDSTILADKEIATILHDTAAGQDSIEPGESESD